MALIPPPPLQVKSHFAANGLNKAKFGVVGFCWGGHWTFRIAADTDFGAAAAAHPARVDTGWMEEEEGEEERGRGGLRARGSRGGAPEEREGGGGRGERVEAGAQLRVGACVNGRVYPIFPILGTTCSDRSRLFGISLYLLGNVEQREVLISAMRCKGEHGG